MRDYERALSHTHSGRGATVIRSPRQRGLATHRDGKAVRLRGRAAEQATFNELTLHERLQPIALFGSDVMPVMREKSGAGIGDGNFSRQIGTWSPSIFDTRLRECSARPD
jgi:hypothetical protein